ncbi:hypothetical protein E2320_016983 [Naja naja]|nr:hypothetical protein E2320_016983 [Naja naja]
MYSFKKRHGEETKPSICMMRRNLETIPETRDIDEIKENQSLKKAPSACEEKSTEAGDTHKSKSQNIHHKRKTKNKDSEHLGSGSSSEPNQNGLCTKVRHEESPCRKAKSDILCHPNPSTSSGQKPYFFQKIKF